MHHDDSQASSHVLRHDSFQGHVGISRSDITPPEGMYWRLWGAAAHDTFSGVHRPLSLTVLTLQDEPDGDPLVLVDSDLICFLSQQDADHFVSEALARLSLDRSRFIMGFAHSHASPFLTTRIDPAWPGGELLRDYYGVVFETVCATVKRALGKAAPAVLTWHSGHCNLANNRDLIDERPGKSAILCGFNPGGEADDTLLVGRVTNLDETVIATIVNYACHPTTLAWDNELVSPDYVGAMRETIERETAGAPAMFLQGASGDLAPRYQYVGDTRVADANGRQLGFAALAVLADMEPPATEFLFDDVVQSGAPLAVWQRVSTPCPSTLRSTTAVVDAPLKDWPAAATLDEQYRSETDRALQERLRRQRDIRRDLGDGKRYALPLWVWQVGDTVIAATVVEAYSVLQQELRRRFPDNSVVVIGLANGLVGYAPPAALYDSDIYQVWQTPLDRGSLELILESLTVAIEALLQT